jgi:hypothetical protein
MRALQVLLNLQVVDLVARIVDVEEAAEVVPGCVASGDLDVLVVDAARGIVGIVGQIACRKDNIG